jgi:O-antigen ligase
MFAGYCVFSVVSVIKAANKSESLYAVLVALNTGIFFVLIAATIDKKTFIRLMVYLGLFLASFGLYEIIKIGPSNMVAYYELGFTNGRNLWASTLLFLLPFALYSAFKKNRLAILTAILLVIDIVLLQTRSVYLGLFVATIITLWSYRKWTVIPLLIVTVICICSFSRLRNYSSLIDRFQSWGRSVKTYCDEPLFGVGAGNWKIATPRYGNTFTSKNGSAVAHYQRAHNDFLEVFVETGFMGGMCYVGTFLIALYYSFKARDRLIGITMRFGIISYMVFAFFSFPRERAPHTMLILAMIALIVREYHLRREWIIGRNYKAVALCTLVISFLFFVNYERHKAEWYLLDAMNAKVSGEWEKVIEIIDKHYSPFATMLTYSVTPVMQYRAEANFVLKNHEQAFIDYKKAYQLHPNHACILANIGYYEMKHNDLKTARDYYKKANKICPHIKYLSVMIEKLDKKILLRSEL